jgi:hypothetical protein
MEVPKEIREAIKASEKLDGMDYHLSALSEAYKEDGSKKGVLGKIKTYKENLKKLTSLMYDEDPKKLSGNLLTIYNNISKVKADVEAISREMGGDISYKKNKYKRGDLKSNTYKVIRGLEKYIKDNLSAGLVEETIGQYKDNIKGLQANLGAFKKMVKQYVGSKVYAVV